MSNAIIKVVGTFGSTQVPIPGTIVSFGPDDTGQKVFATTDAMGIAKFTGVEQGMKFAIARTNYQVYFGTLGAPDANGYIEQIAPLKIGGNSGNILSQMESWFKQNIKFWEKDKGGNTGGGGGGGNTGGGGGNNDNSGNSSILPLGLVAYALLGS